MIYLFTVETGTSYVHHFYDIKNNSYLGLNCTDKIFYNKKYYYYRIKKHDRPWEMYDGNKHEFTIKHDEYVSLGKYKNITHEFCENYILTKILENL